MTDFLTDWEFDLDLAAGVEAFEPRRPRWFLLLIGLALGLAAGLWYTWELNPVQFYNTDPVDLHPQYKETWIVLVAATYRQDGDLDRAMMRLAGLKDPQIGRTVAELTERHIQVVKSATRIRALALLADALGARTPDMMIYLATPGSTMPTLIPLLTAIPPTDTPTASPSPSAVLLTHTPTAVQVTRTRRPTPTATVTPRPTITRRPAPTTLPPYSLEARQRICQTDYEMPRIEIFVQTKEGIGLAGSDIWVTWSGGVDHFVTGLKPEIGLGYADFEIAPDVVYAVAVGDPTLQVVDTLRAEPCLPGEADSLLSSWRLVVVATQDAFTPTPNATPTVQPRITATSTSPPTGTPRTP